MPSTTGHPWSYALPLQQGIHGLIPSTTGHTWSYALYNTASMELCSIQQGIDGVIPSTTGQSDVLFITKITFIYLNLYMSIKLKYTYLYIIICFVLTKLCLKV